MCSLKPIVTYFNRVSLYVQTISVNQAKTRSILESITRGEKIAHHFWLSKNEQNPTKHFTDLNKHSLVKFDSSILVLGSMQSLTLPHLPQKRCSLQTLGHNPFNFSILHSQQYPLLIVFSTEALNSANISLFIFN